MQEDINTGTSPMEEPVEGGSNMPVEGDQTAVEMEPEQDSDASALAFLLALTPLLTLSFFGQIGLI